MLTSKNANVHELYEFSVQSPEEEVEFIHDAFRRYYKKTPLSLREDFCGTALLASRWVHSRRDRSAVGVDLDPRVLAWGKRHHVSKLSAAEQKRLKLVQADVRQRSADRFDVVCAYNYSWWVLKARRDLVAYFKSVRAALKDEGLFLLDTFGGSTSQQTNLEPRSYRRFKYIWEQASYNPLTGDFRAYIHFEFKDGSRIDRAFSYDWRLWHVTETRDALLEAGFSHSDVFWEDTDARGYPNGYFRPRRVVENEPSWNAYIVAKR
jgi:SAM-dependent methyltransferase